MSTVANLAEWRMKKNPAACLTADELADQATRLDNLRLVLMDALYDIKSAAGDVRELPVDSGLLELRSAIESAMSAASAIADHCDLELERRILAR